MKSMRKQLTVRVAAVTAAAVCTLTATVAVILCVTLPPAQRTTLLWELLPVALGVLIVAVGAAVCCARYTARTAAAALAALSPDDPQGTVTCAELQGLAAALEDKNRRTAKMLEDLAAAHEQQDTMRRDFTANVSHELKTPLTSISGYAELLQNGLVQSADVPRFAGKIYDESQRLITLVGDIIKLSQLDSKEVAVREEDIDLYEMCAGVLSHLEMAAKKHAVTVTLTGEPVTIHAAEQIVEEMIFNLCDNAIKYNRAGGNVDVTLRQCVDGVELTVKDTGIGISDTDLPHIFERFYRADKSHSKAIGGTGLGLSIVKHGARYLGAAVSVESTPDVGTTVRVLF